MTYSNLRNIKMFFKNLELMNSGNVRQEEKRIPLNVLKKALIESLTFSHFDLLIVSSQAYLFLHLIPSLQKMHIFDASYVQILWQMLGTHNKKETVRGLGAFIWGVDTYRN